MLLPNRWKHKLLHIFLKLVDVVVLWQLVAHASFFLLFMDSPRHWLLLLLALDMPMDVFLERWLLTWEDSTAAILEQGVLFLKHLVFNLRFLEQFCSLEFVN